MHAPDPHGLIFPFPEPPAPGQLIEVAPGIFWARIALPFRLDHVNIYLIEDSDGFAVIDTGIGDEATRQAWLALMAENDVLIEETATEPVAVQLEEFYGNGGAQ